MPRATRQAVSTPNHTRLDIQGLRAFAVLSVVANHAFGWPSGGFVGVDIFFVLSGFLITGLLVREYERTGTISFIGFYRRRIRRIVPAAVLALVVTVVGSYFLLGSARFASVVWDALSSLLFVANWRFAITGTDYFQATGPTSPLQHYWSLSVEEQFYLVWPWLMLLVIAIAGRNLRGMTARVRVSAGVAIGVLGAASFAWALYQTATNPTVAYFSTFSRAWELAFGAVLAILVPVWQRVIPESLRPLMAWIGLAGMVLSLFVVSSSSGFPAPAAAFPVLATGLVLIAGTAGNQRFLAPITNPVSRYLGDISYSLYLWHFPVIIVFGPFLEYLLGGTVSWYYYVLLMIVAFGLSIASYHLVEDPIRRSKWLEPRQRRRRVNARAPYLVVAGVAAVTVASLLVALNFTSLTGGAANAQSSTGSANQGRSATDGGSSSSGSQAELNSQISQALKATSWPADLTPSVADASDESLPTNLNRCGTVADPNAAMCTYGDPNAPHHAVLVGDSIAQAYAPGLIKIFGTGDWSLRVISMYACPFIDTSIGATQAAVQLCTDRKQYEYNAIAQSKPDLLLISNTFDRGTDPATGKATTLGAWNTAFQSMIKKVAPSASKFVVLPPPPFDKDIQACYKPFSKPSDCVSNVANSPWVGMAQAQEGIIGGQKNGTFIDNRDWYCDSEGLCPPFVASTLEKKDAYHPTLDYVLMLVPAMTEAFQKAGLLPKNAATAAAKGTPSPTASNPSTPSPTPTVTAQNG